MDFFVANDPKQAAMDPEPHPPDTFFFEWDGETGLDAPGQGWVDGSGFDLYQTLTYVLQLHPYEYEGPPALMALRGCA